MTCCTGGATSCSVFSVRAHDRQGTAQRRRLAAPCSCKRFEDPALTPSLAASSVVIQQGKSSRTSRLSSLQNTLSAPGPRPYQTRFGTRDQQDRIVQAKPRSVLPPARWTIGKSRRKACRPRRIYGTYSRQRPAEGVPVPVSSSRAVRISSGKALAYASARWTSTRGQRKWLAVVSTDLVSSCTASTSQTATR